MTSSLVLASQSGAVRCLELNRPEVLNSFNGQMHAQLMQALDAAAADPSVRCLVLAGSGRAFCAGQDLSDPMAAPPADLGRLIESLYVPLVKRLKSMPVPIVARVQGAAAGGAPVWRCAAPGRGRTLGQLHPGLLEDRLVLDAGGTWLLPRLVGGARAMGLAMLGDKLPAEEAQRIGLIWQCVPDDEAAGPTVDAAGRAARRVAHARAGGDPAGHAFIPGAGLAGGLVDGGARAERAGRVE